MKKIMMLALALSLAVILAACGNDDAADDKKKDDKDKTEEEAAGQAPAEEMEISDEEKVKEDDVVVKINGEDIKGDKYNSIYPQIKMQVSGMGQEVDQDQLKEHTIDALVGQELLRQEVEEKGVEVPEKEVDAQIKEIKSQDEDQYKAMMEQLSLTEESLKEQLAFELTLDKYAEEEFKDTEASDEEVEEFYEQLKEQGEGEEVPDLKDMKDQIKAQISEQKKQEATQKKVEELKEKAEIKTMI